MIGTVHVDPASATAVRDSIVALKPEVVALELDEARMMALESPKAQSGRGAGVSFLTMALLERVAGQMTGSQTSPARPWSGMTLLRPVRSEPSDSQRSEEHTSELPS